MHAHRSELMCIHMHTLCTLIYTHVHAHTGMPTDVHSGIPMCTLSCLHSHVHKICMHTNARPQVCTHMYTLTHVHSLVHPSPALHGPWLSVNPSVMAQGQEAGAPGAQHPPLTWQQGGSIPVHQQAPPISTASERSLTYTGSADSIFLLHA